MRKLLVVLLLIASPALADELIASNGADVVRLSDKPCSSEAVLSRVTPRFHQIMRDATALVAGAEYRACWVVNGESAHLLYEDGDQGIIPLSDFKLDNSKQ